MPLTNEFLFSFSQSLGQFKNSNQQIQLSISLAPTAYMYSNGLLLSQAPAMITGYPPNAPCAYFTTADYASFADPTHLTATISPYAAQTGPPLTNHHSQANNNAQYGSPPDGQPMFAPISTDLTTGQVYGFAPITRF